MERWSYESITLDRKRKVFDPDLVESKRMSFFPFSTFIANFSISRPIFPFPAHFFHFTPIFSFSRPFFPFPAQFFHFSPIFSFSRSIFPFPAYFFPFPAQFFLRNLEFWRISNFNRVLLPLCSHTVTLLCALQTCTRLQCITLVKYVNFFSSAPGGGGGRGVLWEHSQEKI